LGACLLAKKGEFMTLQKIQGKETRRRALAESTWKQMSKSMQENQSSHKAANQKDLSFGFCFFSFEGGGYSFTKKH
jgi:hypothetical protein